MTADLFARDKAIARLRTRVTNLEQDAAQTNAAIERVRQLANRLRLTSPWGRSTADNIDAALDTAQQPTTETPEVTVHACPGPDDNGISPCCKRPPFEFRGERITRDPEKVTCPGPTQQSTA